MSEYGEHGPFSMDEWEHLVKKFRMKQDIKIRKNFAAYIELSVREMEAIDTLIADLQDELNVPKHEAIKQIFAWGLDVARKRVEGGE